MNDDTANGSLMNPYENSELALMDSFKAAALKVTTLYKDSLVQNRKAYVSGYQQALQDLYEFISYHPTNSVTQQDISPNEHGFLPVQDLLVYARQRNEQLTAEMGLDQSTSLSPVATTEPQPTQQQTASSTNATSSFDSPIQQHELDIDTQPAHLLGSASPSTATSNGDDGTNTTAKVGGIGTTVRNAFHPFQIDPNTQFSFSLPGEQQPWCNTDHHRSNRNHQYYNGNDIFNNNNRYREHNNDNDINNHYRGNNTLSGMDATTPMDGFKRRFTQQELTFMGRTLNNLNIDSNWNEPPYKKRFKKDD